MSVCEHTAPHAVWPLSIRSPVLCASQFRFLFRQSLLLLQPRGRRGTLGQSTLACRMKSILIQNHELKQKRTQQWRDKCIILVYDIIYTHSLPASCRQHGVLQINWMPESVIPGTLSSNLPSGIESLGCPVARCQQGSNISRPCICQADMHDCGIANICCSASTTVYAAQIYSIQCSCLGVQGYGRAA